MHRDVFKNKAIVENDDLELKKLLKEKDNLKVPEEISKGIDSVLNDIRNSKTVYKNYNSLLRKIAMVAIICLSVTTVASFTNPTIVRAIPIVGKIFDFFAGETVKNIKDDSLIIGKSVKDKGITLTAEEVAMYGNKVIATFKVQGKVLKNEKLDIELRGKINGDGFSYSSSKIKRIDESTVAVLFEGSLIDSYVSESVDINFYMGGVLIDNKEINGDWRISTTVNKAQIEVPSREIKSSEEINVKGFKFTIDNLVTSSIGNSITMKSKFEEYDFSNKNDTEISNDWTEIFNNMDYIFIDSNGKILLTENLYGTGNISKMESNIENIIYGDISYSDYIDIIPVIKGMDYKEDDGNFVNQCILSSTNPKFEKVFKNRQYYNVDKENSFLKLDELKGKSIQVNSRDNIEIKDIECTDMYTKITMKVNGYYDLRKLGFVSIIDEDFNEYTHVGISGGAVVENSSKNEVSVTLPPLDEAKKYTITLLRTKDVNLNEIEKIRVNLK
ncbi:DUF4179 domain-containing protein [Clostridium tunisiense]|uniref:DUF4179 domain-containing protein n=1 Tax=Clostridium tunisiense TaxID=219748 RepID=UPI0002EB4E2E|nr:DUF4179 domain-containing protein [Clostridium tunisiense]